MEGRLEQLCAAASAVHEEVTAIAWKGREYRKHILNLNYFNLTKDASASDILVAAWADSTLSLGLQVPERATAFDKLEAVYTALGFSPLEDLQ